MINAFFVELLIFIVVLLLTGIAQYVWKFEKILQYRLPEQTNCWTLQQMFLLDCNTDYN